MTSLFHYCSTSAFDSIISNRSIQLSSLRLSNDTMEGKLVNEIIEKLAIQDALDDASIKNLHDAVRFVTDLYDGLGFCLSEVGDLLSQWRGYADDATGFSIGFSKEYLLSLPADHAEKERSPCILTKVEYDLPNQEALVKPTYEEAKQILNSGELQIPSPPGLLSTKSEEDFNKEIEVAKRAFFGMYSAIHRVVPNLYALKTDAFREEQEWRLTSYVPKGDTECSYKTLKNCIVPYIEIELTKLDKGLEPILEVVVGPKNLTPTDVVQNYLNKYGFDNVTISRSKATYR